MSSSDDAPGAVGEEPIVVHPGVHGETLDWSPAAPPATQRSDWRSFAEPAIPPGEGQSPPPPELAAPPSSKRAFGLDALRGFFLTTMTLGFTIGVDKFWPLWMFHRQEPWGAETPLDVAGISWRDLA